MCIRDSLFPKTSPTPARSVTDLSPIGSATKLRCFCEVLVILPGNEQQFSYCIWFRYYFKWLSYLAIFFFTLRSRNITKQLLKNHILLKLIFCYTNFNCTKCMRANNDLLCLWHKGISRSIHGQIRSAEMRFLWKYFKLYPPIQTMEWRLNGRTWKWKQFIQSFQNIDDIMGICNEWQRVDIQQMYTGTSCHTPLSAS